MVIKFVWGLSLFSVAQWEAENIALNLLICLSNHFILPKICSVMNTYLLKLFTGVVISVNGDFKLHLFTLRNIDLCLFSLLNFYLLSLLQFLRNLIFLNVWSWLHWLCHFHFLGCAVTLGLCWMTLWCRLELWIPEQFSMWRQWRH